MTGTHVLVVYGLPSNLGHTNSRDITSVVVVVLRDVCDWREQARNVLLVGVPDTCSFTVHEHSTTTHQLIFKILIISIENLPLVNRDAQVRQLEVLPLLVRREPPATLHRDGSLARRVLGTLQFSTLDQPQEFTVRRLSPFGVHVEEECEQLAFIGVIQETTSSTVVT